MSRPPPLPRNVEDPRQLLTYLRDASKFFERSAGRNNQLIEIDFGKKELDEAVADTRAQAAAAAGSASASTRFSQVSEAWATQSETYAQAALEIASQAATDQALASTRAREASEAATRADSSSFAAAQSLRQIEAVTTSTLGTLEALGVDDLVVRVDNNEDEITALSQFRTDLSARLPAGTGGLASATALQTLTSSVMSNTQAIGGKADLSVVTALSESVTTLSASVSDTVVSEATIRQYARAELTDAGVSDLSSAFVLRARAGDATAGLEIVAASDTEGARSEVAITGNLQSRTYQQDDNGNATAGWILREDGTASIDAANIRGNLKAAQVAALRINADQITAGTITADRLSGDAQNVTSLWISDDSAGERITQSPGWRSNPENITDPTEIGLTGSVSDHDIIWILITHLSGSHVNSLEQSSPQIALSIESARIKKAVKRFSWTFESYARGLPTQFGGNIAFSTSASTSGTTMYFWGNFGEPYVQAILGIDYP